MYKDKKYEEKRSQPIKNAVKRYRLRKRGLSEEEIEKIVPYEIKHWSRIKE